MIEQFVIFGAAGDLTGRYLLPALLQLHRSGQLPERLQVIGSGRHEWSDEEFRAHAAEKLRRHAAEVPQPDREELVGRLVWRRVDATDPNQVRELVTDRPAVFYLALPPAVYASVADALGKADLPQGCAVVVEKPFGTDRGSARDLNQRLGQVFPERAVFRIDHFLGKQTVQNVLGLRFANRIFEPVWHHAYVSHVDIIWDEQLGLEGRAEYYDHTGALRDMIQNHLLQLLSLVAMEPPVRITERDLRDRKMDVFRATRVATPAEAEPSRRARYTAGTAGGTELPDYIAEEGVDPARDTETFAEVTVMVDNWRWAGVPFRLRTGKGLGADRTEIALHFRPVPHLPFPDSGTAHPNVLRMLIQPDRIGLSLNLNGGGDPLELAPAELDLDLAPADLPAYARLLLEVLQADPTLSIRGDEAEEAWRIVEPVLATWERGEVPMQSYPAGSSGPAGSAAPAAAAGQTNEDGAGAP